jgi:hypothetical protein
MRVCSDRCLHPLFPFSRLTRFDRGLQRDWRHCTLCSQIQSICLFLARLCSSSALSHQLFGALRCFFLSVCLSCTVCGVFSLQKVVELRLNAAAALACVCAENPALLQTASKRNALQITADLCMRAALCVCMFWCNVWLAVDVCEQCSRLTRSKRFER